MNKRMCDNCKKAVSGGYVDMQYTKVKELIFESFDICEKCIDSIPKILKTIKVKKA